MDACLVRPNETCFLYPHVIHVFAFCLSIVYPYLAHLFMCKIKYCFYHPFSDPVLINIRNDISLIHVLLYSFILSYTIHTFMVYIHGIYSWLSIEKCPCWSTSPCLGSLSRGLSQLGALVELQKSRDLTNKTYRKMMISRWFLMFTQQNLDFC